MTLLLNHSIIISGASSGIGAAAAEIFAKQGANLVLVARDETGLQETAAKVTDDGGQAIICAGDICDPQTHEHSVDRAMKSFGRLDGAFNNAGTVGATSPLAEISLETFQNVLTTNLTGAFLAAKNQIPAMIESGGGSIVFTGSFVGVSTGLPTMGAYATAKSGLLGLVRSITADYATQGIRSTALIPGGTHTKMAGNADNREWAASLHAMKRLANPDEIAQAALFLLSNLSSFVSGSTLWADGGNAAVKV
ncbi:SDR family oxidoreductase [Parasphingorhabdus flavimaris]|uniref:SDR family oxidoreductase n=1 Tax=Parasphingorhabdus flavimaris TaxID=266812 RepID=A0ABX2N258_9SPHN|nr:SDR family oxidoreductase [Parasphingorhabdus flavimaris]NVD27759.1 SDR family oxidoreductase [Parasphingorhabdus flavimaris]|tara:strand:+ start:11722 stop:12474 length:753 start_codon:yes stop_codon:yes gene_type:complete